MARRHLNPQAWILICLLFFPRFNLAVKSGVPALQFSHPLGGDRLGSNGGLELCYRNEEFPEGSSLFNESTEDAPPLAGTLLMSV